MRMYAYTTYWSEKLFMWTVLLLHLCEQLDNKFHSKLTFSRNSLCPRLRHFDSTCNLAFFFFFFFNGFCSFLDVMDLWHGVNLGELFRLPPPRPFHTIHCLKIAGLGLENFMRKFCLRIVCVLLLYIELLLCQSICFVYPSILHLLYVCVCGTILRFPSYIAVECCGLPAVCILWVSLFPKSMVLIVWRLLCSRILTKFAYALSNPAIYGADQRQIPLIRIFFLFF